MEEIVFYKVMKNDCVIDLLQNPIYVKYQKKHDLFLSCDENEAQGVMSSDSNMIWHVHNFPSISKQDIDTIDLVEIDQYEYNQLKVLNMKTPQEIIDQYTLSLLDGGFL